MPKRGDLMRKPFHDKIRNFNLFRAEIKRELTLRCWTYDDLGKATGYAGNYIQKLMSGTYGNRKAAFRVLKRLDIDTKPFW